MITRDWDVREIYVRAWAMWWEKLRKYATAEIRHAVMAIHLMRIRASVSVWGVIMGVDAGKRLEENQRRLTHAVI
jgi:hypothetical protein